MVPENVPPGRPGLPWQYLGELLAGFRKGTRFDGNLERLREGTRFEGSLGRLREFPASPRSRRVGLDDETADRYSVIHDALRRAGTPVSANDLWIAASAMQHGLRVLTTDPHFRHIGQIAVTFHPAR